MVLSFQIKRGQSALEFLILVGAVLFFFTGFFIIIQQQIAFKKFEEINRDFKDVAENVQEEINLAKSASDGYMRDFEVPETVNGLNYEINISDDLIFIKSESGKYALSLPVSNVTGDLVKGSNSIQKVSGEVLLNG